MYKLMFNERDGLYYVLNMGTTPISVEYTNPHIKNAIKECARLNGETEPVGRPIDEFTNLESKVTSLETKLDNWIQTIETLAIKVAALEGKQSEMDDIGLINRVFGIYKELDALKAKQAEKWHKTTDGKEWKQVSPLDVSNQIDKFTKTIAKFNDRVQRIESQLKKIPIFEGEIKGFTEADKKSFEEKAAELSGVSDYMRGKPAAPVVEEVYKTKVPNTIRTMSTIDDVWFTTEGEICRHLNANLARRKAWERYSPDIRNFKRDGDFRRIIAAIDAYEDGK